MHLRLLAVGTRMPVWVQTGFTDFAGRLPREWRLQLLEIPIGRRAPHTDPVRAVVEEGKRILVAVAPAARLIALDGRGRQWSTEELAAALAGWQQDGHDLDLVIGGPDGLAPDVLKRADHLWSLSRLTFPHALVRILVAEQIYRAWSILQHHPYHRA
jgi:23S rRNA (pseudouridine1915-N3)-methyltransferase